MLKKILLAVFAAGAIAGAAHAQALDDAVVYTVRVPTGLGFSDAQLQSLALTRGTIELLRYYDGEPLERVIIRLGDEGLGCPGFTSLNRTAAEEAVSKGAKRTKTANGETVSMGDGVSGAEWHLPNAGGKEPFRAVVTLNGKPAYTETRHEQVLGKGTDTTVRPTFIRLDYENGETIGQFYDWESLPPSDWINPYEGFAGSAPKVITKADMGDPAKSIQKLGCRFRAQHGFTFDWDSEFWPGGGTSPGAFPLQVRLQVGAGWGRGAEINGEFIIDDQASTLAIGQANGHWWVDYGAELNLLAALTIPLIPSIVIDVDKIISDQVGLPSFDMRWQEQIVINSWLLGDAGAPLSREIIRRQLFNVDLVDVILSSAGVSLPSWIPLSAGVRMDGSIEGVGTLRANSLTLSDGTQFTQNWQTQPISITGPTYSVTAELDTQIDLEVRLHAFPELYAEIIFTRFDLPLGDLMLPLPIGNVAMDFDPCNVTFNGLDYDVGGPEGEGAIEPEGQAEGQAEGEGEFFEGEGFTLEGEGGNVEGEGEIIVEEPLEKLNCTVAEPEAKSLTIADMNRTVSTVHVAERGAVEQLEIWLDLYHLRLGDVAVSLISPKGTSIDLFSFIGGNTAHMRDTYFSDDAFTPIRSGSAPYGGLYEPFDPLSLFKGENAQGDWQLVVHDINLYNRGVLVDWKLTINPCPEEGEAPLEGEAGEGEAEAAEGEAEGEAPAATHSLDYSPADNEISLSELLRAIQIFNTGWFSCDPAGEDGYRLDPDGTFYCGRHTLDYNPHDWRLSLGEILRAIQFFNSGGYHAAPGTEDGFAPGK